MESIKSILSSFDPISLEEMDNVKLMDRMDTKYVFRNSQLPSFLESLKQHYRVLNIEEHRMINYESVYFDTHDFMLYRHHQSGRMNRFKIRYRKYVESDLSFFEIKFKNNKDRTIKSRIRQPGLSNTIDHETGEFLQSKTGFAASQLHAQLKVDFIRITFVNKNTPERVTVDLNLKFSKDNLHKSFPNVVIAEVKQEKSNRSEFVRLMKRNYVRIGSLSKYCFAVANLFPELKKNNFKQRLIYFNKLNHDLAARP